MKTGSSKLLLIISGAILFNMIFWNEKMGVNTIIFDMFICASIFFVFPYSLRNNISKWLFAGHLITGAMVLMQNTILSKISFSATLLLFISFSQYIHRSAWYAGGSALLNYVLIIPNFFRELKDVNSIKINLSGLSRFLRMFLIPLGILTVFFIIYSFANTVFSGMASDVALIVEDWLTHFFDWFSPERIGFFLLGILIVGGLILRSRSTYFSDADLKQQNDLSRKKIYFKKWRESPFADLLSILTGRAATGILALKNEFTSGIISLILLNTLLLLVNIIDLQYVWLGYTYNRDSNLSAYVHEGAGLLILSIVLSMLLLLFFFRGNLNFYKKNKWLRFGAYLWILQNSFLVFSVFMRNYYYISHYGLAYKRIGLLFFLVMVLAGLFTVFLKIYYTKTTYYLLRINAWLAILLLVFASLFNIDETIAEYNLARKSLISVDVPFLLSLSDKTLPLLLKNKDVLEADTTDRIYYKGTYFNSAVDLFEFRVREFLEKQQHYTWLSWNTTDAYIKEALSPSTQTVSSK